LKNGPATLVFQIKKTVGAVKSHLIFTKTRYSRQVRVDTFKTENQLRFSRGSEPCIRRGWATHATDGV